MHEVGVAFAMLIGGIILGIIPGIVSYIITLKIFRNLRSRSESQENETNGR